GQHARGVVIIEELPAHLEVELPADLLAALLDVPGLEGDVPLPVEADPGAGVLRRGGGGRGRGAGVRSGHPGTLAPSAAPGPLGASAARTMGGGGTVEHATCGCVSMA